MDIISSSRLDLIPMSPEFLAACLEGSRQQAEQIAGFSIPDDWLLERDLIQIRWKQLRKDPDLQPWLLRAIVFRDSDQMVGHIGFHTRPGADYLKRTLPRASSLVTPVFPPSGGGGSPGKPAGRS